jgi:glycosidase
LRFDQFELAEIWNTNEQSNFDPRDSEELCPFNIDREWREEFIYFLMVDRFHDDTPRTPVKQPKRSLGIQVPDNAFYGGKINGITRNLDYIAGLGCTAIWLSPVFVNNPGAYHGYNINNYLEIDSHFGTRTT